MCTVCSRKHWRRREHTVESKYKQHKKWSGWSQRIRAKWRRNTEKINQKSNETWKIWTHSRIPTEVLHQHSDYLRTPSILKLNKEYLKIIRWQYCAFVVGFLEGSRKKNEIKLKKKIDSPKRSLCSHESPLLDCYGTDRIEFFGSVLSVIQSVVQFCWVFFRFLSQQ